MQSRILCATVDRPLNDAMSICLESLMREPATTRPVTADPRGVPAPPVAPAVLPPLQESWPARWRQLRQGAVAALLLGGGLTLIARALLPWLDPVNLVMIYLLGVVLIALRFGRTPATVAAVVYVGLFDFFFVEPHFSFAVSDMQYLVTFAVMLAVGLLTGQLTAGARYQAQIAQHREQRAHQLFELSQALSATVRVEQIAQLSCEALAHSFQAQTELLVADANGQLHGQTGTHGEWNDTLARLCLQDGQPAGLGSERDAQLPYRLQPLSSGQQPCAVLLITPRQPRLLQIPEQIRLLELFGVLIAVALERIALAHSAEQARLQAESERLRNSLLSALSHDLRTPLTALFGQAELLTLELGLAGAPQVTMASAMRQQVLSTTRLVNNLLDMARLQSGGMTLRQDWQSLPELLGTALHELMVPLQDHPFEHHIPPDFPLLYADAVLLERVLVNLLENGCKYAGPGVRLGLNAHQLADELQICIWDEGPGLPPGKEQLIFEKFARGNQESVIPGVGLGLAICRAIVEAHGGQIRAENRPQGGACFCFTLPWKAQPPLLDEPVEMPEES